MHKLVAQQAVSRLVNRKKSAKRVSVFNNVNLLWEDRISEHKKQRHYQKIIIASQL